MKLEKSLQDKNIAMSDKRIGRRNFEAKLAALLLHRSFVEMSKSIGARSSSSSKRDKQANRKNIIVNIMVPYRCLL